MNITNDITAYKKYMRAEVLGVTEANKTLDLTVTNKDGMKEKVRAGAKRQQKQDAINRSATARAIHNILSSRFARTPLAPCSSLHSSPAPRLKASLSIRCGLFSSSPPSKDTPTTLER